MLHGYSRVPLPVTGGHTRRARKWKLTAAATHVAHHALVSAAAHCRTACLLPGGIEAAWLAVAIAHSKFRRAAAANHRAVRKPRGDAARPDVGARVACGKMEAQCAVLNGDSCAFHAPGEV